MKSRNRRGKRVVILGGGVAGMSAAHELAERGFQVEVFERKSIPGGKARSTVFDPPPNPSLPSTRDRPPGLPGEHGFRFFPRFYRHVVDTMTRIPVGQGFASQNLVDTTRLQVARFGQPPFALPARSPRDADDLRIILFAAIALMAGQIEIPLDEAAFFAEKMWRILTSCEERRMLEYERINWWDFIEAESKSLGYQKYFGSGITRSLVAAKARRASTKTIGDIFMQIVFDIAQPGVSADRVLNGPTNEVWMGPWLAHLRSQGVNYHLNSDVRAIQCERGAIRSATVAVGNRLVHAEGDYFLAALPVERMAELVTPELLGGDPSLANLDELTEYVEWMNGIQYYLTEDVPLAHGHSIYVDSPWALTSISQPQFWPGYKLSNYGDGKVNGLLSVDISDWDVKGLNGKEARHCSREEIAREVWEQLKRSVNHGAQTLRDDHLHSWFLDPDIAPEDAALPGLEVNAEPLLVNYVDTWRLRPEAVTRIPNLFLASDYVRTFTDLATMEAANEAARRAVNGIIRQSRADVPLCELWNLHEPEIFLPLRAYDRIRFRKGLSWDSESTALARSALELASAAARLQSGSPQSGMIQAIQQNVRSLLGLPAGPPGAGERVESATSTESKAAHAQATTARAARASSNDGLTRLRIVR